MGRVSHREVAKTPIPTTLIDTIPLPPKPTLEQSNERIRLEKINNNRVCIINQPHGLADIIFCEPIAQSYYKNGYKVIWPVEPQLYNINKHFPKITFVNKSLFNNYDYKWFKNEGDALYVPLMWANQIMHEPSNLYMASKYNLYNMPLETWRTTSWIRDKMAEQELFYNILQIQPNEKYNLICNKFRTDYSGEIKINTKNSLRNIFVEPISDYTLIDWSMVIEKATNIYTVVGAINIIIEFLHINAKEYHVFPKEPTEKDYDYILTKTHIMVE